MVGEVGGLVGGELRLGGGGVSGVDWRILSRKGGGLRFGDGGVEKYQGVSEDGSSTFRLLLTISDSSINEA